MQEPSCILCGLVGRLLSCTSEIYYREIGLLQSSRAWWQLEREQRLSWVLCAPLLNPRCHIQLQPPDDIHAHRDTSKRVHIILRRALRCFAPVLRNAIDNMVANIVLPSAATMSRDKSIVDIVWMKTMADFHQCIVDDDAKLFGMMDSSPQGGRNWLMSEYSGLRGRDLRDAARAAQTMAELANAPVRANDLGWQLRVNASVIQDAFFTHVLPPSGLGSRHGSAAHKCHTWLHQHRLECLNWRSVQRMLFCYFSVAVDKGPEQKVGKIKTSAGAMFPWWIDVTFDDDGLMGLPPDHDDVGDDGDVRLDSTHIITVNGTYHLVELIQQSILAALGDFAEIKSLLESACYVFHHGYLRCRFTEVLVGDRLLWQLSFRSGPPLFEGGRAWGVLIKIATWFRERKVMIIASWPRDPHSPKSKQREQHVRSIISLEVARRAPPWISTCFLISMMRSQSRS